MDSKGRELVFLGEAAREAGSEVVLVDVSLNVPAGRIVALVGGNGNGKSTTLRAAAGRNPLDGGSITFNGTAPVFNSGSQFNGGKKYEARVRAVRRFPLQSFNPSAAA